MLKFKFDVLAALKDRGYTSYRIRQDRIFGESEAQKIRSGAIPSKNVLNKLCELLDCQPGDLLEYVPDVGEN